MNAGLKLRTFGRRLSRNLLSLSWPLIFYALGFSVLKDLLRFFAVYLPGLYLDLCNFPDQLVRHALLPTPPQQHPKMSERRADIDALESFIQSAPPGELGVVTSDIQNILLDETDIIEKLSPAFKSYHESQFAVVKIGKDQTSIISEHNRIDGGSRYFDIQAKSSYNFDPISKNVTDLEPYDTKSKHIDLIAELYGPIVSLAKNHHTSSTVALYPSQDDSSVAIIIVANQYNSRNYWNGRWRSCYLFNPTTGSLTGKIKIDIHYFEDGNVRFMTEKEVGTAAADASADRPDPAAPLTASSTPGEIAAAVYEYERQYHERINSSFAALSTGPLKDLRPKLPVTKQKIDWDKIAASKIGHDLAGITFK